MLIDSFLKYKGFDGKHKGGNAPLIPYIIADALSIAHDEYLKGKLKQEAKKFANRMMKCYDHLNKDFFRAFTFEEGLLISDKLNNFDDFLHDDFENFREAVMKPLSKYPQEVRETISGLCLCKFLATQMEYLYRIIYRDQYGRNIEDKNIKGILHNACEMFRTYRAQRKSDYIDLNDIPMVQESVNNIIKRTQEFLNDLQNDNEEES